MFDSELVLQACMGSKEAAGKIVAEADGLIVDILKKNRIVSADFPDFIQDLRCKVLQCIKKFNLEKATEIILDKIRVRYVYFEKGVSAIIKHVFQSRFKFQKMMFPVTKQGRCKVLIFREDGKIMFGDRECGSWREKVNLSTYLYISLIRQVGRTLTKNMQNNANRWRTGDFSIVRDEELYVRTSHEVIMLEDALENEPAKYKKFWDLCKEGMPFRQIFLKTGVTRSEFVRHMSYAVDI